MPGTNRETLLRKVKDICHIICLTNVSVCHIVLPASANGESVSSNVTEFGRKYSYYFCFPGSKFCFCNKSQCFQMLETRNNMGLILFGGGGGGTVLVCPTPLLTQYTYTTLFKILSGPFLRIFPWGEHFLKRDLSVR